MKVIIYLIPTLALLSILYSCDNQEATPPVITPTFNEVTAEPVTYNSARIYWGIMSEGSYKIEETGLCWSTIGTPTINNNTHTIQKWSENIENYLNDLQSNIEIYIRPYMKSQNEVFYGNETTITLWLGAPGEPVKDADGNVYQTVKIGNQVWIQENLKTTKYNNGTPIPIVDLSQDEDWVKFNNGMCCYYNDDANNPGGILYNTFALMDPRGVAPNGYRIGNRKDWFDLMFYCSGGTFPLLSLEHWNISSNDDMVSSKFNILPVGIRKQDTGDKTKYSCKGNQTYFFTEPNSDKSFSTGHCHAILFSTGSLPFVDPISISRFNGVSVRCIKED